MFNIVTKWSITAITLWTVLISDNKFIYTTAVSDVSSNNDATPRTEYGFIDTSTIKSIHKNLDLEILPPLTKYTLKSNSSEKDRTFTCKGNEPVQWYFKQYDNTIFKTNSPKIEEFSKDRNSLIYLSILSLNNASYLDTGRYYCAPRKVEPKLIGKFDNSSIYIFVQDDTHLIASPNDFDKWFPSIEYNSTYTLIPCRPTSPDVDAQVTDFFGNNITEYSYYEEYTGFVFQSELSIPFYNVITCIMKRNGIIEKRNFVSSAKNIVTIKEEYTVVQKNLTLTCSINPSKYVSFGFYGLEWIIPKQLRNQPERVQFDGPVFIRTPKDLIQLKIKNASFKDNGEIICRLFYLNAMHMKRLYDQTYNLQIIPLSENYLKLKLQNNNGISIRPVGYSVKWTVQFSSVPNTVVEWFGPNNNKLEDISEKIRVITKNDSSELVIRNLQVSDSGVYIMSASNTYEKKEINFTLFVEDLEISPHVAEYILTKNSTEADRILTCKGNEPVQWYFQEYDGNFIEKKSSNSKIFSKDQNNYKYVSLLSLRKATYMDTGYYYCTLVSIDPKFIKDFKNIYVFVYDETHLFAIPEDVDTMQKATLNALLPCRPTSPDINVKIFYYGSEKTTRFYYDNKKGFIFFDTKDYANYTCTAEKNNMRENRTFIGSLDGMRIYNEYSNYVISGQDVTLKCVIKPTLFSPNLEWIIPDGTQNKSKRITYGESQNVYLESSYIKLNIQNVTIEDEGFYVCAMRLGNDYDVNITYELKVHSPGENHLSLEILNNKNTLTRPVGYHSVHWEIQVIAQPEAILEWRDSLGNKLNTNSEKIFVKNENRSSELTIRDLELSDSGNYTLIAYNKAERKEINVTLIVEG